MNIEQLSNEVQLNLGLDCLPEFVHDEIGLCNHADVWGCALDIETCNGQEVPVRDIVGIAQPPFDTWIDFLLSDVPWDREKFDLIFKLALTNPGYYESDCDKDGWSFTCVDGRYYTLSGHHRAAIVKLMGAAGTVNVVRNVTVEYIQCDTELLELTTHVREKFKGLGEISIYQHPPGRYFRFRPRLEFCLLLDADVDSFRSITRGKALLIFFRLVWLSYWTRFKLFFD